MTGTEIALVGLAAVSAVGTIAAGQAAADANDRNAEMARQRGELAIQQSEAEAGLQKRATDRKIQLARANLAASGIDGAGPLDVLADQAQEGELGRQMILYKGKLGQWQAGAEAANYDRAAGNAKTASYFGAATTLLGAAFVGSQGYTASSPRYTGADQVGPAMNNISTGVGSSPY